MKKIIFLVIVLALAVAGFFYWWHNQADVRELNKTLPEGVKVDKCLLTGEYKVINKIDGYEFKIPLEWQGIDEIAYIPERVENEYIIAGIELAGREGESRILVINHFTIEDREINLKGWVEANFETFGLIGDFNSDKIGEFDVIKTQENVHLFDMFVYFFKKDSVIYAITNPSEDFIRYIITYGKW